MIAILQQTWQTVTAHKVKSALAVIAIAWGMLSVIILMAIGEGFYRQSSASLAALSNDIQITIPSQTSKSWQGIPQGRKLTIPNGLLPKLKESGFTSAVSAVYGKGAQVTNSAGVTFASEVAGIDADYADLILLTLQKGSRGISPSDMKNHNPVAVVGKNAAKAGGISLGDTIRVNGYPLTVVGLMSEGSKGLSFGDEQRVMIPQTLFKDFWISKPDWLLVKPAEGVNGSQLRNMLQQFFARELHFDPSDRSALTLPDLSGAATMINSILRGIEIFLATSGVMTLAVGALGVANIMFLSVTERTREIGVRLAVGARQHTIMTQFIIEGTALVILGMFAGLSVAAVVVRIMTLSSLPEWMGQPVITVNAILIALIATSVLALLASYFPARRAARLTPVIALTTRG